MAIEFVSVKKIAESWGVSTRRIGQLCNAGKIEGAKKIGGLWKIPANASRPPILRDKTFISYPNIQTSKLLPLPVGISDYKKASSMYYYVDKTLMIKDFLDERPFVTLFTRPRRFGKTLNMDMLKTYFEKTTEDTSVYFSNRAIWACNDSYKAYQGKFPVIFLSFKDAHQSNWKDMYENLSLVIRNEFKRHMEILDNEFVLDIDKEYFRKVLKGDVSEVETQISLGQLSNILAKAYKSRIVVIIDEYDTPIQQGFSNGFYKEVIAFMRNLFSSVLKDNPVLEFGILTGILRIAKESLFSGLNNLTVNTILDEKYSKYFGFTISEIKEMSNYYGKSDKFSEIKDWYDGYLFGKSEIYNPWSVINYFSNDCKPKAFWSRTSSNDIILELIQNGKKELKDCLLQLLQNKPIKAVIDTDLIYPEIKLYDDSIYSFLLMTGYLKVSETIATIDDNPVCNLLIPNREIKGVFKKEILDNLSETISKSVIRDFQIALKTNDTLALQNTLRQYLLTSASSFDTAKENFYHGLMLGLLAIVSDEYLIASNIESGNGRFDIRLKPILKNMSGIIMEFKAAKDATEDKLIKLSEEALNQIKTKQYFTELKTEGFLELQLYGIAFSNKKATVKTEKINLSIGL